MRVAQQFTQRRARQQPCIARQVRLVVVAGRQSRISVRQALPTQGVGQQPMQSRDALHLFRRQPEQRAAAALQLALAQPQSGCGTRPLVADRVAQPLQSVRA